MINPENKILNQIKKIVEDFDPKAKIYLYGTSAKGTSARDSDWDLLILVSKDVVTPEDEQQITFPLYNLSFITGEVITPVIYPEKLWHSRHRDTPFYRSIMKAGKEI